MRTVNAKSVGRRSLERVAAALLTGALLGCTQAGTTPEPTPGPVPGAVAVLARPDALVFSSAQGQPSASQAVVLQNPSSETVSVTSLSVPGGEFQLVNAPALPVTLAPGAALNVQVRLTSSGSVGVVRGSLVSQGGAASVSLAGLRARGLEGSNEPTLSEIVDALGVRVNVGWSGLESDTAKFPLGEEVIAPMFVRAAAGAVTLTPVARYSPDGATPFGFFTLSGSTPTRRVVGTMVKGQYQTLNPQVAGATTFDPGSAAFGVYIDPSVYSYPLTYTKDALNTGRTPHAVRVYPLRDASGVVANAFVLGFEPSVNGDYQDVVFVIRNVKPAN